MNTITLKLESPSETNFIYEKLQKLFPKIIILKEVSEKTEHEKFMTAMRELSGSIDDPTFVEPSEIAYEAPRRYDLI